LDGTAILPLVTIRTRRQYSYVVRAGATVAELSLDEGAIMAGGRAIGFRELEVELLEDGTRADLDALINHLQARFPHEWSLWVVGQGAPVGGAAQTT
jgi:inorganic triphosphatase YgiF